ncbi:MAG: hypothetical protein WC819_05660 [Parcubacteria group bacterium]|jgi:hypothetical protein
MKRTSFFIFVSIFFFATSGFCFPRPPLPPPIFIPIPVPVEIEGQVPPPPPVVERHVIIDDSHLRAWRKYHGGWINLPQGYAIELREVEVENGRVVQFHFIPEGERQWKKYDRKNPPNAPPGFENLTRVLDLGNGQQIKQFITIPEGEDDEEAEGE